MADNKLKEAAEQILHLHLCEQEGISSGMPTKEQWLKAVEDLEKALNAPPNEGGEDYEKYFNHIRGQLAWVPLEDEHIKNQVEGALESLKQLELSLAGRSSNVKPEMTDEEAEEAFEQFLKQKGVRANDFDGATYSLAAIERWGAEFLINQLKSK